MRLNRKTRILLLETDLDRKLSSTRSQIPFMQAFIRNLPRLDLVSKQIHSRADLRKFLAEARRPSIRVVHLVAHGVQNGRRASVILTKNEMIDLRRPENLDLFRGLTKKLLFFSCCQLGRDAALMRRLLNRSGAAAVFSYADDVTDDQAFLIEALFYHLAFRKAARRMAELPLQDAYLRLRFGLAFLRIDEIRTALVDPLLVADIRMPGGRVWSSDGKV
jgi:hypothetical protein